MFDPNHIVSSPEGTTGKKTAAYLDFYQTIGKLPWAVGFVAVSIEQNSRRATYHMGNGLEITLGKVSVAGGQHHKKVIALEPRTGSSYTSEGPAAWLDGPAAWSGGPAAWLEDPATTGA